MRIAAITLGGLAGWPTLELRTLMAGLNAVYGPPHSGKTALADLLAHSLFGKPPATLSIMGQRLAPPGEVIIESGGGHYRVRRYQDAAGPIRLTVASLDGVPADQRMIHKLVRGLSPTVLSTLCAVSFREPPDVERLLSAEFARGCQSINGGSTPHSSRRTAELAARRDLLAQELETRIAGERRVGKELEARWRELDRCVRDEQQQVATLEQRMNALETSLAETDARLRYRRLELNVELRWQPAEPSEWQPHLAELDEQVAHWRAVLAELGQHEANVRARLAQLQSSRSACATAANDQRAWLAVARQLAADLAGEVARLARASASEQCVCRDAHPRLRPIAETIERQIDLLATLVDEQHRAFGAAELQIEADHLAASQAELRRHVDHLLDRRQTLALTSTPSREDAGGAKTCFSAADAEQLGTRRAELEQERFELVERIRTHARVLRDLRAQRETVERQRAALLSARSIEHVQRELAAVQQKLEHAANNEQADDAAILDDSSSRASDFLAQLTNGDLVQFILGENGRRPCAVNRAGETLAFESLSASQRDQVYMSFCLALLTAASRQGIWLPLVLDEPFERLDDRATFILAAVLDDFSRQGHQVLVFTGQRTAAERLTATGAAVHDILSLRQQPATRSASSGPQSTSAMITKKQKTKRRIAKPRDQKTGISRQPLNGDSSAADHSDAA